MESSSHDVARGLRWAFTALVNSMRCSARLARAHADVSSAGFYAGAGPSAAAAVAAIAEGSGDAKPTSYSDLSATAAMGWPPRTTDGAAVAAYARLPLCRYRCGSESSLCRRDFTVSTMPPDTPCEHCSPVRPHRGVHGQPYVCG